MSKFIAVDIETNGLHPEVPGSKIWCIAINDGKNIEVLTNPEKARKVLEDKSITKVIHNAAFDCYWLAYLHGINVTNIWDTRLMEQVILGDNLPRSEKDEQRKIELSSSLKYTLKRYGLADLEKTLGISFTTRDHNKPLTKEELEYVKNDVLYLLQLQALQEYRLTRLDLMRVANLENMVVEKVVQMRLRGVGFNKKLWLEIARQNELEQAAILKTMPPQVSNWNSPAQIKKYFAGRGVYIDSLTNIEDIFKRTGDPMLGKLIQLRKYQKLVSTYGRSWLEDSEKISTVDTDGKVRAQFEQIVNTGRFACSHPNMQQLPRDTRHREAFVPSKGNVFVIGDFAGQELGIMAAASKEELWIKAMLRDEDVHSLTASLIYGAEWSAGTEKNCSFPKKCSCSAHKKMRENAKTINFAIAYGAGPSKIGKNLGLSQRDAIRLLDRYKKVVPRLIRWLNTNAKHSIKTRTSFSADPYKRRRTLRDPEDWMLANIGKNNPVQACGANMIKLAMVSTDLPIVMVIHDEIIVEVKKADAKKACKELKSVMEKAAEYCTGIPGLIKVQPQISKTLSK